MLAPFFSVESAANRPRLVAEVLGSFGPVDVVTTSFDHQRKAAKPPETFRGGRVVHLRTRPYRTNVSVGRFASHVAFARHALGYVAAHAADYDVLYATAPLNLLAARAFRAAGDRLTILDVVDVWPDVLPFPPAARRAGWPLFRAWKALFADACRHADLLLAVSDTFLAEGRRWFAGEPAHARRFYIGHASLLGEPRTTDAAAAPRAPDGRTRIAYVGNIGRLYDFETLLDALDSPGRRGRCELAIVGAGDREAWLLAELERRAIPFTHHGVVYDPLALARILASCDAGFNGYRNTSAAFSYKATTYLAAGLPLVNSMTGDLEALVGARGLGANYRHGDAASLVAALDAVTGADRDAMRRRCVRFFREEIETGAVAEQMRAFLAQAILDRASRAEPRR